MVSAAFWGSFEHTFNQKEKGRIKEFFGLRFLYSFGHQRGVKFGDCVLFHILLIGLCSYVFVLLAMFSRSAALCWEGDASQPRDGRHEHILADMYIIAVSEAIELAHT